MTSHNLDATYGAMYIGLLFAVFFQGVLTVQAYIYYERFPTDPLRTKLVVVAVWIVDLVHLVLISRSGYHYFISNWGNAPALLRSTAELDLHLALIGLATVICQGFFLHRIWLLSNRQTLLVVMLALGCLTTFGFNVALSVVFSKSLLVASFARYTPEVIALFSSGAGIDLILAAFLCYYLIKGRSGIMKSNNMIDHIVQFTVATGLVTSLLALGCLIAYLVRPHAFIHIALHFSLGRLYTNALLASLNARRNLRRNLVNITTFVPNSHILDSALGEQTFEHDRAVNGIQVVTTIERVKEDLDPM